MAKKEKEAGIPLLRSYRGLPKNTALIKFLSENGVRALLQKTENHYMQDQNKEMHIKEIMKPPFPFVHHSTLISDLSLLIDKNNQAVLMNDMSGNTHIITKFDIIDSISHD